MSRMLPVLLACWACAGGGSSKVKVDLTDPTGTATGTTVTGSDPVTWYDDVAPVLLPKCGPCHQAGGIGPFSMTTYEEVQP